MKSDHQLEQERKAEASGRLLDAWRAAERAAQSTTITPEVFALHEEELGYAMAIASEHGLDPQGVLIGAGAL